MAENEKEQIQTVSYGDENIIHLDDMEHIRRRPGIQSNSTDEPIRYAPEPSTTTDLSFL